MKKVNYPYSLRPDEKKEFKSLYKIYFTHASSLLSSGLTELEILLGFLEIGLEDCNHHSDVRRMRSMFKDYLTIDVYDTVGRSNLKLVRKLVTEAGGYVATYYPFIAIAHYNYLQRTEGVSSDVHKRFVKFIDSLYDTLYR